MLEDYFTGRIIEKEKYNRIIQEEFNQNKLMNEQLLKKENKHLFIYFLGSICALLSFFIDPSFGLFVTLGWLVLGIPLLTHNIKHLSNEQLTYKDFEGIYILRLLSCTIPQPKQGGILVLVYVLLKFFIYCIFPLFLLFFSIPICLLQIAIYLLYTQRISFYDFLNKKQSVHLKTEENNYLIKKIKKDLTLNLTNVVHSPFHNGSDNPKFKFYTGYAAEYRKIPYRIDEYRYKPPYKENAHYLKIFNFTLPITLDGTIRLTQKTKFLPNESNYFPEWLDGIFASEYNIWTETNTNYSHFLNKTFYDYLTKIKKQFNATQIDIVMYENQITFLIKPNVNIFSAWGFSRQKHWNKVCEDFYSETSVVYEMMDYLNRSV